MSEYLIAARRKWRALKLAVIIRGKQEGDKWREKRPNKFVIAAEEKCKLKTSLLENNPDVFQGLRHPAGCSLQYVILLNELLGGPAWHRQFCNKHKEVVPETTEADMSALLRKLIGAKNV